MSTKVTDLEKFVREEVWRPYWPSHPEAGPRLSPSTPEPYQHGLKRLGRRRHTPMETRNHLLEHRDTEWHRMVIGRLARIGFWFPTYIVHPLVDYLDEEMQRL